jgi:hypothetical protein
MNLEQHMLAHDVARLWGGVLKPVSFNAPQPILPASTVSFLHYAGLPNTFRIGASDDSDYLSMRFQEPSKLSGAWSSGMPEWSMPVGWDRFWRLGDATFTQCKTWLCIEELTGRIYTIDVEADTPVNAVNSSAEQFVHCMKVLIDASKGAGASPQALSEAIRSAVSPEEAQHFWLPVLEDLAEQDWTEIQVESV